MLVRADGLRDHAGEVSFPGGKVEPGESVDEAMLREVEEEIGHSKVRSLIANPDEDRDAVRRFLDHARDDVDLALIAVARGDYGDGVHLAIPEHPRAVFDRYRRGKRALMRNAGLVIPPAMVTTRASVTF